jgi:nickel transport protein
MTGRKITIGVLLWLLSLLCADSGLAHGTDYEILTEGVVGIRAMYDSGEVMGGARVLIFAPDETRATYESKTDKNGIVCFFPDREGTWILQIRDQGGHGMRVNLEVDTSMTARTNGSRRVFGSTAVQRLVLVVCVLWGFVGTGLFFYRRRGR